MKNNIIKKVSYFTLIIVGNIQFTLSQTTHTVNYTIPSWNNATGSFTFETGTMENPFTKRNEGYIKLTSADSKIIEITPQLINRFIQKIDNNSIVNSENNGKIKFNEEKTGLIEKFKQLKSLLEDELRMNELIDKLQNNTDVSGLNWDYTVQTIRNFQTQVTGTVD